MANRFIIGSGFYRKPNEQWPAWFFYNCFLPCARSVAENDSIFVLSVGNSGTSGIPGVISLSGNLRHVHALLGKEEPYADNQFCGWSGAIMALALIAYNNESDLVFLEADCLAFGPWIERLYADAEGLQMVFGRSKMMPCEQSLVLIKHAFIPEFVRRYIEGADERNVRDLPENRFIRLMRQTPSLIGQHSIGPGRDRPLPLTRDVWSAQKFTPQELLTLRANGLVMFAGDPPDVQLFSSTK